MSASYPIQLTIENFSGLSFTFDGAYYEKGSIQEGTEWPHFIPSGEKKVIMSSARKEDKHCSGYVTYEMGIGASRQLTIAFSNDGTDNKVAAGPDPAMSIFHRQDSYGYKPYTQQVTIGSTPYEYTIQCTKGEINLVTFNMRSKA